MKKKSDKPDLDRLRALFDGVTKTPWIADGRTLSELEDMRNIEFVYALVNAFPALLSYVEELESMLAAAKGGTMSDEITIVERCGELIRRHGSYRAAAAVIGIDHGYFWRLCTGAKTNPSGAMLKKLGLRKFAIYRRVKP